jgi:cell division protein FtsL
MKKNKNKRNSSKDMKFLSFTCSLLLVSGILCGSCSIGLKAYNNSLSIKKQSIEENIASMQTQNNSLQVEIRQLASADRVNAVAANNGMTYNQNSISTVSDGTTKTDGE